MEKSLALLIITALVAAAVSQLILHGKSEANLSRPKGTCRTAGQYLEDTENCDVFYQCDAGLVPQKFHCAPGNLCWNQAGSVCQWKTQPGCNCK